MPARRSIAGVCCAVVALAIGACSAEPSAVSTPTSQTVVTTQSPTPTAPGLPTPTLPASQANFPPGVGDIAPDFTLPVATGGEITLSQFRGDTPVVLVFYRAFW